MKWLVQHDDLQAITWETDFGDCVFEEKRELKIPEDPEVLITENPIPTEDVNPPAINNDSPPVSPEIFPTGGEDPSADEPNHDEEVEGYNLRPSTHPFYSDKYR